MKRICKYCNTGGGDFGLLEITDYDWDSDSDTALSIPITVGYQCAEQVACARRTVELGTDAERMHQIKKDYENMPKDLRDKARAAIHELAVMARARAHTADLVAREAGYGAIGGGARA